MDVHNTADSEGKGSDYDKSFGRKETRPISTSYLDPIIVCIQSGWLPAFISFIGIANKYLRDEVTEKVRIFNQQLSEYAAELPQVLKHLPLLLRITSSKQHWRWGKPACHVALASTKGVRCGVHIDDCQEVCDAFSVKFRDEDRIFRIRYHYWEHFVTHKNGRKEPRIAYSSLKQAFKALLQVEDIRTLCEERTFSHRGR